jgi:hypothetical protein
MSDVLKVGFIMEGKTDGVYLEAVLEKILNGKSYIPNYIQPEYSNILSSEPKPGGWGQIYHWCIQAQEQNGGDIFNSYIFDINDIVILHIDGDVSEKTYRDINVDETIPDLPCVEPCPPINNTIKQLERVIYRWLGITELPIKMIFCIPARNLETWICASMFFNEIRDISDIECNTIPETILRKKRIYKDKKVYSENRNFFIENWENVLTLCSQAKEFNDSILTIISE